MAAFALTSQISELDNFNLETSFEDFVKETQHKLLSMPTVQTDEEEVPPPCDFSSFMALNFDAAEKQPTPVIEQTIEALVTDELAS